MPGELQVGLAITIAFLIFIFLFFFINVQTDLDEPHSKYKAFLFSKPNEIGDTLAGFAGALAFLWLVVTVMLQSKELKAQREELVLARKEYARMASAQERQEGISRASLDELSRQYAALSADQELEELISAIVQDIYSFELSWIFEGGDGKPKEVFVKYEKNKEESDIEILGALAHELFMVKLELIEEIGSRKLVRAPDKLIDFPSTFRQKLQRAHAIFPSLSSAKKTKFNSYRIGEIADSLDAISDQRFWSVKG